MKGTAYALALALGATTALAQAPATPPAATAPAATAPTAPAAVVPQPKCEPKPVYPGPTGMQDEKKVDAFRATLKAYQDCVKAYVAERKTVIDASNTAIRALVEEHNAVMNKIRLEQEALKKEAGK
ncbi:MAG: hypothetical protein IPP91_07985 [Betaproteobacteria bacterium]|nr:hypothetical protein [Betaproteobacteria bacterium]